MIKSLRLAFKGSREYLHGTDFFNALTDAAQEITGDPEASVERLTFRRYARLACDITTVPPVDPSMRTGQARFKLPHGQSPMEAWLVETETPVTERRPFDEALLLANASLDKNTSSACLLERSVYTPIEDVIALTKHLNYFIAPNVVGQWAFGQLDLLEPLLDNYQALEIQMKSIIANRYSVSDIQIDGRLIGSVRFIVGEP